MDYYSLYKQVAKDMYNIFLAHKKVLIGIMTADEKARMREIESILKKVRKDARKE